MLSINNIIRKTIQAAPAVVPCLTGKARFIAYSSGFVHVHYYKGTSTDRLNYDDYKTYDYMLAQIEGLVRGVYNNNLGGDFIDVMANVISGQLTQAYQQAFEDAGFTDFILPDYLQESLTDMIANQYDFVDNFFQDIVDARIDGTPIDPLLQRAQLWAGQWNTAYEEAKRLIAIRNGAKMVWREGDTVEKCDQCVRRNGIVAYAAEWEALGVHPKGFPNDKLGCKGGHCDCTLEETDKRRSPNAFQRIKDITNAA
jgi:hypothetical protein